MTSKSPIRVPNIPALYPSFRSHRAEIETPRLGPNIRLSKPLPSPAWASLPSPPMSGSPPPEERTEPPQLAGQRRKRSDTPPATTAAAAVAQPASAPAQFEQTIQRHGAYLGQAPSSEGPRDHPVQYTAPYATSQPYGYGTSVTSVAAPSTGTGIPFGPGQLSPRATRKTKAHVASACVNCKKKHLRCDHARPCNRCVATGKENTCFDVEHKKRGRPPLKPEDSASRRPYEPPLSPLPGASSEASRRLPHAGSAGYSHLPATYQRDIRPLQTGGFHEYGGSVIRPGPRPQSMYAPPTVSPSPATAMGTMISTGRPFSGDLSSASTQSSNPYTFSPSGYSPYPVENLPRSLAPFGSTYPYPQQPGSMLPPSQPPYSYPLFPRDPGQPIRPAEDPVGLYGTSSLQLPPIRPAPQGSFEPAMAQQQRQAHHLMQQQQQQQQRQAQEEQQGGDDGSRQPDPKRPRMDIKGILGPRND